MMRPGVPVLPAGPGRTHASLATVQTMPHLTDAGLRHAGGRLAGALPQGRTLPEAQWAVRHRGMRLLLWAHVPLLFLIALAYGFPVGHSALEASIIVAFAVAAEVTVGSRRARALPVVFGLLTCSAVLVHITGGLIEAHFHYFVMVAVLSLYEDWIPFLCAIAFVLLQHGVMATMVDRHAVFDHGGSAWRWAIVHSGFICALSIACLITWRANERQRSLVASLVDSLEEGVMMVGPDGRILAANPSAQRILGRDPAELVGTSRSDPGWTFVDADGQPLDADARPAAHTALTGEPRSGVVAGLRRDDGRTAWLSLSSRAVPGEDARGPFPVVVSFTDITEERAALAALEHSNAELQQFAYVASHDLSEPLRMVSSYLQLLRRRYHGRLDEDADEFIDYAVEGAGRMRSLIEDLLAYSRAGRGAAPERVELQELIADVLRVLAGAVVDARAQVTVGDLPAVEGDAGQLRQLLQNLVANALKFRGEGRARVWVEGGPAEGQPGMAQLCVADAGIGIDPRHHDRVFKMFQRLHDREAYEGTGIGLAICRKIVERHGGQIWIDERAGGGTAFRFTLPLAAEPAPLPSEAPGAVAAA
jgi:PAS domain S-box-containing protein